ncbi:hypothetical protein ALC56_02560 [Trachymyrmex septentrionalis]|uniref:Uncharacterized protein n=1 Tax=Trachymyrmex septentrionalis TaxID=34720 RepID=A0A195FQL6_9HYME|nr:hypothetical protein ALC56_02560 [Trachymyrmex septentrionalis]
MQELTESDWERVWRGEEEEDTLTGTIDKEENHPIMCARVLHRNVAIATAGYQLAFWLAESEGCPPESGAEVIPSTYTASYQRLEKRVKIRRRRRLKVIVIFSQNKLMPTLLIFGPPCTICRRGITPVSSNVSALRTRDIYPLAGAITFFTLVELYRRCVYATWTKTEEPDRASLSTFFHVLITSGLRGSGCVVWCKEHVITRSSAIDSSGG